jgi:ankyrin repeat protein
MARTKQVRGGGNSQAHTSRVSKAADPEKEQLTVDLLEAIEKGQLERVKELLTAGADVNAGNATGWMPLGAAVCSASKPAYIEIVQLLLAAGAKMNVSQGYGGWTLLHTAAASGSCGLVQLLLEAGAEIDRAALCRTTPLHAAAAGGHHRMVELLVAAGAYVDTVDNTPQTPLHAAACRGHQLHS